jgi:predicted nucleic acid-binding protein
MKVIGDTSSIIKLQRGGALDCLGQLFEAVLIPPAVQAECRRPETQAALQRSFLAIFAQRPEKVKIRVQ